MRAEDPMRRWWAIGASLFQRLGRRIVPGSPRDRLGRAGERLAEKYLRRLGYRIVARRYRCPHGELDLVAVSPDRRLVFVEVKTRRGSRELQPGAAVTRKKQRRIIRAAWHFRARRRLKQQAVRYDIIAITWPEDEGSPELAHDLGAFGDESGSGS